MRVKKFWKLKKGEKKKITQIAKTGLLKGKSKKLNYGSRVKLALPK